jgi:hypothetical protein
MSDDDGDRLTGDEHVVMLRIAVRLLTMYDEHAIAHRVESAANAIQIAAQEGKAYRPIGA